MGRTPDNRPRAVVLLSGGMDSCVTAAIAARDYRWAALHSDYGQRTAARERVEREGYVLGDHKAVRQCALQARGVALHLVRARLRASALEGTGLPLHASLAEALEAAGVAAGRGVFVQDAGVCVPRIAS